MAIEDWLPSFFYDPENVADVGCDFAADWVFESGCVRRALSSDVLVEFGGTRIIGLLEFVPRALLFVLSALFDLVAVVIIGLLNDFIHFFG